MVIVLTEGMAICLARLGCGNYRLGGGGEVLIRVKHRGGLFYSLEYSYLVWDLEEENIGNIILYYDSQLTLSPTGT